LEGSYKRVAEAAKDCGMSDYALSADQREAERLPVIRILEIGDAAVLTTAWLRKARN
jgi:hypothetical protein